LSPQGPETDSDDDDDSVKSESDRLGHKNVIVIPDQTPIPEDKESSVARPISDGDRAPPTPESRDSDMENEPPNTEQIRLRQQK